MQTVTCPRCGFYAEVSSKERASVVWAEHLLGGCGDDPEAIAAEIEVLAQQRQELWAAGLPADEVTELLQRLWEALRYAR